DAHADEHDAVLGYAASRAYRETIAAAFDRTRVGTLYPTDPESRQLTEHFRDANLAEFERAVAAVLDE
ncbi:tRNA-guanine transglycosylase, partial [Halobacteriales archaeon SW_7_68_16]